MEKRKANTGAISVAIIVISMWYWMVIAFVNIGWIIPGMIAIAVVAGFYLATRKSGAEYKQRFFGTYAIGVTLTAVLNYFVVKAPLGVGIANSIIMPALMCGAIHAAHEFKK